MQRLMIRAKGEISTHADLSFACSNNRRIDSIWNGANKTKDMGPETARTAVGLRHFDAQ